MKRIALLSVCFASLIIIGCDKKNSNSDMADEAEQPFVMKTPKTGNLPFETLTVTQDGGQYYISALTEKKEGDSVLMMAFAFDERTKTGEAISISACFFGPYGLNGLYASQPSGGKVFLKGKKGNNLVLRFKDIRFILDEGEYQLNGDLTFSSVKTN